MTACRHAKHAGSAARGARVGLLTLNRGEGGDNAAGPELFDAWEAYIKALAAQLNDEQNRLLKNQILGFAKMVASAAGGILGFGKVSGSEEKVLHRIEAAFAR